MRAIISLPLTKTLLCLNIAGLLLLLIVTLIPLPSYDHQENNAKGFQLDDLFESGRSLDDTVAREQPIFHVNRLPAKTRTETQAVPKATIKREFEYELVGILGASSEQPTAYVRDKKTEETLTVQQGQTIGNGVIEAISNDQIIVIFEGREITLKLSGG
jgi:hypothetical protein